MDGPKLCRLLIYFSTWKKMGTLPASCKKGKGKNGFFRFPPTLRYMMESPFFLGRRRRRRRRRRRGSKAARDKDMVYSIRGGGGGEKKRDQSGDEKWFRFFTQKKRQVGKRHHRKKLLFLLNSPIPKKTEFGSLCTLIWYVCFMDYRLPRLCTKIVP